MTHARPIFLCLALFITIALAASTLHSAAMPAFLVNESEVGDLNGDGDATDSVLHVLMTSRT